MVSQLTSSPTASGQARAGVDLLRGLPAHLAIHIKGQEHVLGRVAPVLIRGELGVVHPLRPRGSFLFVGPTGVGKTETANIFTSYLFGGSRPIRFDMSEYQLQESVGKLIGENRGDPGLLGRALHGIGAGTILFDEIEKAHPLILDLFLQIIEDARITLATGETLDLQGFYIVCTSNIGSAESMRMESAPFASVERTILMRVRDTLRPELIGRISEIIVFARLDYPTQRAVCESMIAVETRRLTALGYPVEVSSQAIEFLVRQGYHRHLGARPMRSAVERFIQEAVSASLLAGEGGSGRLIVDTGGGRLELSRAQSSLLMSRA